MSWVCAGYGYCGPWVVPFIVAVTVIALFAAAGEGYDRFRARPQEPEQ